VKAGSTCCNAGRKSSRERAFRRFDTAAGFFATAIKLWRAPSKARFVPRPRRQARVRLSPPRTDIAKAERWKHHTKTTGGNFMAVNAKSIEAAHASIRALIAEKLKYLVPMTIIFMVGYIGLTVLAGFGKSIMGIKVTGAFNVGYLLITLNYVLSWVLAIVYVRVANNVFDPLAAKAAADITGTGGSR
jgi:uncharacterized membrane protein (DUF485 family)